MTTLYQIVDDGNVSILMDNVSTAIHHAARMMYLDGTPAEMTVPTEFPALQAVGAVGSFPHRIRWEAQRRGLLGDVRLVTHQTGDYNRFCRATSFALTKEFDPSYCVQAALYRAATEDTAIEEIADDLWHQLEDGVRGARRDGESDDEFVERLAGYQHDFYGIKVFEGNGTDTLDTAVAGAMVRFRETAEAAFPDRVASVSRMR